MDFIFACFYKIAFINRTEEQAAKLSVFYITMLMVINVEALLLFIERCFFSIHHHNNIIFIINIIGVSVFAEGDNTVIFVKSSAFTKLSTGK